MIHNRIDIITLGCSKNLVDSEQLMRQFEAAGYIVRHDPERVRGEIVVVNTCGFIGDAKEESVNLILELTEAKKRRKIGRLYVMGCLSERYFTELRQEIPEVDKFYGKFNWKELLADLGKTYRDDLALERTLTTPPHYAYVKIGEGCNRTCSYCAIPIITGPYRSRPLEEIEAEVRGLVARGVKEFQLIAQDLTFYGLDLYRQMRLADLVSRLSDVNGVEWIRLHYGYPAHFPYDLLPVMRERENVCKYIDIALQHVSDPVLRKMRRNVTSAGTYELIDRLREEVPGIHLRTTLMVGHPGEDEAAFGELLDFVRKVRFERMGAFAYCEEEGTYAAKHYSDEVSADEKARRLDALMGLQETIAAELSEAKVGTVHKTVIDREEPDYYVGRTQYDSPEVDPEVLIAKERKLHVGRFYPVRITEAQPFELFGSVAEE